jgi:hypothetical protein
MRRTRRRLCMVVLLQGYVGASDAEAVEMAVMDRRWQLVWIAADVEGHRLRKAPYRATLSRADGREQDGQGPARSAPSRLVREGAVTKAEGHQLSNAVRVAIDN